MQSPASAPEVPYPRRRGPALCRVADQTPDQIGCEGFIPCQTLAGAGLVLPNIKNVVEAKHIVECSKYRPVGKRGIAFNVAHDEYQSGEPRTKLDNANSTNILIAMIESKEGIDNVNDIISTKGVDMAWLGHFDLTDSLGVPGNFKNKIFNNCVESFISACNEPKKTCRIFRYKF